MGRAPISSIRYQQPKDCFQSKASFADERCGAEFRALIRIRSGKSYGGDVSRKRPDFNARRMFSRGHFTFPLAVRTAIASNMIKESAAAEHFSIAQRRDARLANFHAIQAILYLSSKGRF